MDSIHASSISKNNSPSLISLPTSRNGSFSYHQPIQTNQHPILHRCRFTDYTPGTITAIAASPSTWQSKSHRNPSDLSSDHPHLHPSASNSHRAILAVGRGNGDIQIWNWINDQNLNQHSHSSLYQHKKKPISSSQAWSLLRTLPGHTPANLNHDPSSSNHLSQNSKVEHLVFAHQIIPSDLDSSDLNHHEIQSMAQKIPRLLGSNGADEVIEWVWDGPLAGTIKRTLQMPPLVAIWSLSVSPGSTRLAIGCDDGRIRIANISDDQLELIRVLDPCKTRILTLSWAVPESSSPSIHNDLNLNYPIEPPDSKLFIVAGCADSSLRKWAVSSGRCVNRMTVEKLQGEQTLVWSVIVVNGTIVSGDSLGNIHFWDLKSCTRRQTIRAHRADVLCITASADGLSIFTSGVDQKTCQLSLNIQQQTQKTGIISQSRWLLSTSRRLHSHDVRALEVSPPYNPLLSNLAASLTTCTKSSFLFNLVQKIQSMVPVLISGGLDMSLVFCPAAPPISNLTANNKINYNLLRNPISDSYSVSFADSMQRKISYVINRDPVAQIAHQANLLACRNSKRISIWRLKSHESEDLNFMIQHKSTIQGHDTQPAWAKVLEMDLKCRTNLIASAISSDGRWLAVSDLYEVKLFYLNELQDGNLQPRRMKGFQGFASLKNVKNRNQGARSIEFTNDSVRLVLVGSLTSDMVVMGLDYFDRTPSVKILRIFYQHSSLIHQDHLLRPIITPSSLNANSNVDEGNSLSDDRNPHLPLDNHLPPNSETRQDVYVIKMAISPDGQWLATADSTRTLNIYNMDALKHHCYLPIPSNLVNSLAFPPSMPSVLVIGFANNTLQVIDVESRKVPEWAREINGNRPESLVDMRDSMIGMVFQPLPIQSDQNNKTRSNSGLQNDDRSITVDDNPSHTKRDSSAGTPNNLHVKPLPSIQRDQNKVVVGLIWGANWVCKMTIPLPSSYASLSHLNHNHNHNNQSHLIFNNNNNNKVIKKRRFDHLLDIPPTPNTSDRSSNIEKNHSVEKVKTHSVISNFGADQKSIDLNNNDKNSRKNKSKKNKPNDENDQTRKKEKEGSGEEKMEIDKEVEELTLIEGEEERIGKNLILPSFQISHKYQSILTLDYFNHNQLVIVERPFFSFISDQILPPAWHRTSAYGT